MIEIEFKEITFDVIGLFHPYEQGDDVTPEYQACFEIDTISHKGTNFTEFLEDDILEIELLILNKYYND